jgi:hypothetical protein
VSIQPPPLSPQQPSQGYSVVGQTASLQRQGSKKQGALARPITLPPAEAVASSNWQEGIYDVTEIAQSPPALLPKVPKPSDAPAVRDSAYAFMNPAANPVYGNMALPPKARPTSLYDTTEEPESVPSEPPPVSRISKQASLKKIPVSIGDFYDDQHPDDQQQPAKLAPATRASKQESTIVVQPNAGHFYDDYQANESQGPRHVVNEPKQPALLPPIQPAPLQSVHSAQQASSINDQNAPALPPRLAKEGPKSPPPSLVMRQAEHPQSPPPVASPPPIASPTQVMSPPILKREASSKRVVFSPTVEKSTFEPSTEPEPQASTAPVKQPVILAPNLPPLVVHFSAPTDMRQTNDGASQQVMVLWTLHQGGTWLTSMCSLYSQDAEAHLRSVATGANSAFLVRESSSSPGTFVLSWCQFGEVSHSQVGFSCSVLCLSFQILVENGKFFFKALPHIGAYNTLVLLVESVAVCHILFWFA